MANPKNYYPFQEPAGTILQDCFGHVSAQLTNTTFSESFMGSYGVNVRPESRIDFTNALGQFGTADFGIAFFFKKEANTFGNLIGNRLSSSHDNFFIIRVTASGRVLFEVDEDTSGKNYAAAETGWSLVDDRYYHLLAARNTNGISLWLDGNLCAYAKTQAPANIRNGNSLVMGGAQPYLNLPGIKGQFTTLAVYNAYPDDPVRVFDALNSESSTLAEQGLRIWHSALSRPLPA